jgi:transposase, IS5 family
MVWHRNYHRWIYYDADRPFRLANSFSALAAGGDPLPKLKKLMEWARFRPDLEAVRHKDRKSNAGRKAFDAILMFKMLVLQSLYNLSDERLEFQIRDRISYMRLLGLTLGDAVPD